MIELHGAVEGYSRIDFDRARIRRALRRLAKPLVGEARALVARKQVSRPGSHPGRSTGALMRAIKAKEHRSGFAVSIAPFRTPRLMRKGEDAYYPAFLLYGAERGPQGGSLAPRQNYIATVAQRHEAEVEQGLGLALREALIPRKY